jgi:hypothetical protein
MTYPKPVASKNNQETINAAKLTAAHEVGHAICSMGLDLNPSCKVVIEMTEPAKRKTLAVHGSHIIFDDPTFDPLHIAMLGYSGKLGAWLCLSQFAQASNEELWQKIKTSERWSAEDLRMVGRVRDIDQRKAFDAAVALLKIHSNDLILYFEYCASNFLADPNDKVTYTLKDIPFQTPLKESINIF